MSTCTGSIHLRCNYCAKDIRPEVSTTVNSLVLRQAGRVQWTGAVRISKNFRTTESLDCRSEISKTTPLFFMWYTKLWIAGWKRFASRDCRHLCRIRAQPKCCHYNCILRILDNSRTLILNMITQHSQVHLCFTNKQFVYADRAVFSVSKVC